MSHFILITPESQKVFIFLVYFNAEFRFCPSSKNSKMAADPSTVTFSSIGNFTFYMYSLVILIF